MTAKAQMKEMAEIAPSTKGSVPTASSDYRLVPIGELRPSLTNHRRRINDETIASLADSIKTQGILEPLIIRQLGDKFEIVCGERRYRAANLGGVEYVPCLVRELSDDQVLDIQIHENLHREDVHPMDEAFGYKLLQARLGCGTKELALRVGKPEGYVLNRLKLHSLISEAQQDVDDEYLPLRYALELAKYSEETQNLIYAEVYESETQMHDKRWVHVPIKGETVSMSWLLEWINTNVHRVLSKAPFNTKAANLRPDGLACNK